MTEWPPDGYSAPKEYRPSESGVFGISALIGLLLCIYFRGALAQLADPLVNVLRIAFDQLGLGKILLAVAGALGGLLLTLLLTLLLLIGIGAFFHWVVVPVHEAIHYGANQLQGQKPKYIRTEFLLLENPAVINLSRGISVREYVPGALAPFIIIGLIALLAMQATTGFFEGLAAFVLVANSAASGGDLYNAAYVVSLPRGTLFANFEDGNEYKTEYVVPENFD